jgi:putative membrane protein
VSSALLAYLHFVCVIALFACLFAERLLFRPDLALADQRRLVLVDLAYGAVATLVLVTGVVRVFTSTRGTGFYFGNPVFHGMGALFLAAALLSFYPTRRLVVRWQALRRGDAAPLSAAVSARIVGILHIEMVLLLLALGGAVLMARGIGSDWWR